MLFAAQRHFTLFKSVAEYFVLLYIGNSLRLFGWLLLCRNLCQDFGQLNMFRFMSRVLLFPMPQGRQKEREVFFLGNVYVGVDIVQFFLCLSSCSGWLDNLWYNLCCCRRFSFWWLFFFWLTCNNFILNFSHRFCVTFRFVGLLVTQDFLTNAFNNCCTEAMVCDSPF